MLDDVQKKSKQMFSMPSFRIALLTLTLLFTIPALIAYFMDEINVLLPYYASLILINLLVYLHTKGLKVNYWNARRRAWFSVVVTIPLFISLLLNLLLKYDLYSLSYMSLYLLILISATIGSVDEVKIFLPEILLFSLTALLNSTESFKISLISGITAVLAVKLMGGVITAISKPLTGLEGFKSVRALAELTLGDRGEIYERALDSRGEEGEVNLGVIVFDNSAVLTADFHPGPFRAGSAEGPGIILNLLEELNPVFMRAASTHERNLTMRTYVESLAERFRALANSSKSCCIGRPVVKRGRFEVVAFRVGDHLYFLVSGRPIESMEDIPHEIQEEVSRRLGIKCFVIDRHDSIVEEGYKVPLPGSKLGEELIEELIEAGRKALEERCYDEVLVGYSSGKPDWPSVGRGGIRALVIRGDDWGLLLISVDGNNSLPDFRDRLLDRLSLYGLTPILLTTDTHEVLRTKEPFNPLGYRGDAESMIKYVEELAKRAINSTSRSKVRCSTSSFRVKFMGRRQILLSSVTVSISAVYPKYLVPLGLLPQLPILLLLT